MNDGILSVNHNIIFIVIFLCETTWCILPRMYQIIRIIFLIFAAWPRLSFEFVQKLFRFSNFLIRVLLFLFLIFQYSFWCHVTYFVVLLLDWIGGVRFFIYKCWALFFTLFLHILSILIFLILNLTFSRLLTQYNRLNSKSWSNYLFVS